MFDEYCEKHFIEPSEADMIIEAAKQKLHGVVNAEARKVLEDYKTAQEQLENLNKEIRAKEHDMELIHEELRRLEKELEQTDKYDMPRKYINKFVKDITGNFVPGDRAWIIDTECEWRECDRCNGTKEIEAIIDGKTQTIKCIQCEGRGETRKIAKKIRETRIHNVHLKLCFGEDRVGVWTSDSVYIKGQDWAIRPGDIYSTEEEAEKAMKGDK